MRQSEEFMRVQINRQVLNVLSRHAFDLAKVYVSTTNNLVVYISGILRKMTREELTAPRVLAVCQELRSINGVRDLQFDLDNWEIEPGGTGARPKIKFSGS